MQEALAIRQMVGELFPYLATKNHVYCDNQAAIKLTNENSEKRTRHINIKYHFIRDCVANQKASISYILINEQVADGLTKPLPLLVFSDFRKWISLVF
jgi:hypothetical protein